MKTGKHAPNFVLNRLQHRKKRVRRYGLATAPLPSKIQIDRSMAIFLPRSSLDTSASVGKCSAHETAPSVLADSASASSAFSASALVFAGLLHGSSKDQNSFPPPIGNLAIARRCERSESGRYQADHLRQSARLYANSPWPFLSDNELESPLLSDSQARASRAEPPPRHRLSVFKFQCQ